MHWEVEWNEIDALVTLLKKWAQPRPRVDNLEKFWQRREGEKQGVAQGQARWYRATPRQIRRWWEPTTQIYANEGKISGWLGRLGIHVARNSCLPKRDILTRTRWFTGEPRLGHWWVTSGPCLPPHGKCLVKKLKTFVQIYPCQAGRLGPGSAWAPPRRGPPVDQAANMLGLGSS